MRLKLFIIALILLFSTSNAFALSPSVINIEDVEKEFRFEYSNLSYTQIKTIDSSDKIVRLDITLKDKGINSGIMLNFSGNVTYTALTSNYLYLGFIPYKNVTHFMTYQNYTIFRESKNYNTILAFDSRIIIEYDINDGNTSFQLSPNAHIVDILKYYTDGYTGLPAEIITTKSITKFDMVADVKDVDQAAFIKYKKDSLSVISQYIYGILTLNGVLGQNDILLSILSLLDVFFTIVIISAALLFIYPYLILIWIITIGNIYSAFRARSLKEWIVYIRDYYSFIFEMMIKLFQGLVSLAVNVISVIRQMLQI